jgi:hypothetical protein
MSKNKSYDSIKAKALKIKALADSGYKGEATAAALKLSQYLQNHNLTLDDLIIEDKHKYTLRYWTKADEILLLQIIVTVTNKSAPVYDSRRNIKLLHFTATAYEYIEIKSQYDFHREHLWHEVNKMHDAIISAYFNKHNIYPNIKNNEHIKTKTLTQDDIDRLILIGNLENNMSRNVLLKQIKQ